MSGQIAWRWMAPPGDGVAMRVAQALDAPLALGRAMASRGMEPQEALRFAQPVLREELARMAAVPGVEEAGTVLAEAARRGTLGVVADYDVDGACAAAILDLCAEACGAAGGVPVAVPERLTEGYGVNRRVLDELVAAGCSVVAVVDAGTRSAEVLDAFVAERRVTVVVIDHHPAEEWERLPSGLLVNPHAGRGRREAGGCAAATALCAAQLAMLVGRMMLRHGGCTAEGTVELRQRICNLAALGAVCDVMTMTAFNRALVRLALQHGEQWPAGIHALALQSGVARRGPWRADDFGWRIGPRLNAGSRMGDSMLAARCVRERDRVLAREMAGRLEELNRRRRAESDAASAKAVEEAVSAGGRAWVGLADCSAGVAGLVAGEVRRKTGRPAIVFGRVRESGLPMGGSGRSGLGVDLGRVVREAAERGVLAGGGGHAQACGAKVDEERFDEARDALQAAIGLQLDALGDPQPELVVDAELHNGCLEPGALKRLGGRVAQLEPWGNGAEMPLFGVRGAAIASGRRMGNKQQHAQAVLDCEGRRLRAVWWRVPAEGLALLAEGYDGRRLDVCGRIEDDVAWSGEGQMVVEAARGAGQ